jgi:hypothetical protein
MPVSSRASNHTICSELHDLDRQHAAERQAGQRELLRRHLIDHPACAVSQLSQIESGASAVGHDDLGLALEGRNLRGEQARRAQHAGYEKQGCLGHSFLHGKT